MLPVRCRPQSHTGCIKIRGFPKKSALQPCGPADTSRPTRPGRGGRRVICGALGGIPGPPSVPVTLSPSCDKQKCLQTLTCVPRETNSSLPRGDQVLIRRWHRPHSTGFRMSLTGQRAVRVVRDKRMCHGDSAQTLLSSLHVDAHAHTVTPGTFTGVWARGLSPSCECETAPQPCMPGEA